MSDVQTGSGYWSVGVLKGQGYVWYGEYTATEEDIAALKGERGKNVGIDELSLCGRWHPDWNSQWYKDQPAEQRPGGKGSPYYEAQHCGMGVRFTKEEIWCFIKGKEGQPGEYKYCIPPNCGAYHRVYDGDGYINVDGPEPGSEAAAKLDRRAYHWDDDFEWYYPGPDAPPAWWL